MRVYRCEYGRELNAYAFYFTLTPFTFKLLVMRVFCLYRPNSETERSVIELNAELRRRINTELELISVDTVEGDRLAQVYDIFQFPAVVATDSGGVLQRSWTDGNLPLINELSYYLQQS